jgi:putative transposase
MFATTLTRILPDDVVSIDESAIWFDMKPVCGYSPKGRRLTCKAPPRRQDRWSLILAISNSRVIGFDLKQGAMKGADVATFNASLPVNGKRLLLDNAAIHKTRTARAAIDTAGASALFLSPYSPHFQPIEHAFSVVKAHFRRTCPTDIPDVSTHEENVMLRLMASLQMLTTESLHNMFVACWERARVISSQSTISMVT